MLPKGLKDIDATLPRKSTTGSLSYVGDNDGALGRGCNDCTLAGTTLPAIGMSQDATLIDDSVIMQIPIKTRRKTMKT
jgi:hypothetical protein